MGLIGSANVQDNACLCFEILSVDTHVKMLFFDWDLNRTSENLFSTFKPDQIDNSRYRWGSDLSGKLSLFRFHSPSLKILKIPEFNLPVYMSQDIIVFFYLTVRNSDKYQK